MKRVLEFSRTRLMSGTGPAPSRADPSPQSSVWSVIATVSDLTARLVLTVIPQSVASRQLVRLYLPYPWKRIAGIPVSTKPEVGARKGRSQQRYVERSSTAPARLPESGNYGIRPPHPHAADPRGRLVEGSPVRTYFQRLRTTPILDIVLTCRAPPRRKLSRASAAPCPLLGTYQHYCQQLKSSSAVKKGTTHRHRRAVGHGGGLTADCLPTCWLPGGRELREAHQNAHRDTAAHCFRDGSGIRRPLL